MLCPTCKNDTNVTDSRMSGLMVRRRRQCIKCKSRFTTYEIAATTEGTTWSKDLVILDRRDVAEKIRGSLEVALNEVLLKPLIGEPIDNGS